MSPQCWEVLNELKRAGLAGLTSLELVERTKCLGYRQRVTELKRAGHQIVCVPERMTVKGRRVNRYRLVEG